MTQIRRRFTGMSTLQVETRSDLSAPWKPTRQLVALGYESPFTTAFEVREVINAGGRPGVPVTPLQPLYVRLFDGDTRARAANPLSLIPSRSRVPMLAGTRGLGFVPRLGVLIAKPLRDASVEEAVAAISAFVLMCEFTPGGDAESFGATPVAMAEVAVRGSDLIDSWQTLIAATSVNGQVVGQGRAADSAVDLGELISEASEIQGLLPGEVFALDALAGAAGDPLEPGDQLVIAAPALGRLEHTIG